jgi:hypothetical protein
MFVISFMLSVKFLVTMVFMPLDKIKKSMI